MVILTVNQRCCLIGMLDASMQIRDNIDPTWAVEVCTWSVKITTCSFPYIGKSKELNYVRKSGHGWKVINIIHHNVEPISMVNTIYCNNGNGYFSPLRRHRIINTWLILTYEVSKLLRLNVLLHVVFTFEHWLIVLILYAYKKQAALLFWGVFFTAHIQNSVTTIT